jgi:hypothetical protein
MKHSRRNCLFLTAYIRVSLVCAQEQPSYLGMNVHHRRHFAAKEHRGFLAKRGVEHEAC